MREKQESEASLNYKWDKERQTQREGGEQNPGEIGERQPGYLLSRIILESLNTLRTNPSPGPDRKEYISFNVSSIWT